MPLTFHPYYRAPGFQTCQDAMACQGLVDAYNEGDVEKFANILKRPDLRAMDNHVGYLHDFWMGFDI